MDYIESKVKKIKEDRKFVYTFEHVNEVFELHYYYGKKSEVDLFHNGAIILHLTGNREKKNFTYNISNEIINFSIWIEYNVYHTYIGKLNGVGITINDKPVQHTLADTNMHIKNGRYGYFILLFIFIIKIIFGYYDSYINFSSHIVSILSISVYTVPFIILLISFIRYSKWTKFALIVGIIFTSLEMIEHFYSLYFYIEPGINISTMLLWIFIRISALCTFINAFRWKLKEK